MFKRCRMRAITRMLVRCTSSNRRVELRRACHFPHVEGWTREMEIVPEIFNRRSGRRVVEDHQDVDFVK